MTRQSRLHYCKTKRHVALALTSYLLEPRKIWYLTCENEVWAAAEPGHGDDVGEQAPDGFDDPRRVRDALVELGHRRLHALHVLPVVPRGDSADGVADALTGAVDRRRRRPRARRSSAARGTAAPATRRETRHNICHGHRGLFLGVGGGRLPGAPFEHLVRSDSFSGLLADLERNHWMTGICEPARPQPFGEIRKMRKFCHPKLYQSF